MDVRQQLMADAEAIESLRIDILFDRDHYMNLVNPKVSGHMIQALAYLEVAKVSLKLAALEIPEGNDDGSSSDEGEGTRS
jgi:hydrogenase maturation factor HypE